MTFSMHQKGSWGLLLALVGAALLIAPENSEAQLPLDTGTSSVGEAAPSTEQRTFVATATPIKPPYELRPPQAAAVCPETTKTILKADKFTYNEFHWYKGVFAITLVGGKLVSPGIEMTEWANCSEIEIGPGDWYVVMSQEGSSIADTILQFKVTTHAKPDFEITGSPVDQIRPRSPVLLTIAPKEGTKYKSYRLFQIENRLNLASPASSVSNASEVLAGADITKPKGKACIEFEARRNLKPPPSDPAAVIAYLDSRTRQADNKIAQAKIESESVTAKIQRLQREVQELDRSAPENPLLAEQHRSTLRKKQEELASLMTAKEDLLLQQEKARREKEFFKLYHEQAEILARQIPAAERALFDANSQLRNDSHIRNAESLVKNLGTEKLSTGQRRRLKRIAGEAEERIASLWGGIAAFATAEPGAPGPLLIESGNTPKTIIRVSPGKPTTYQFEMTDANGCTASKLIDIDVRKLMVDLSVGTEYSTYNSDEDDLPAGEDEDLKAFKEQVLITGIRLRHAFSDYVEGYGEIGVGALNIEVPESSETPQASQPTDPNIEQVVRDARVAEFELGARYALLEAGCVGEWIPRFLCSQLAGEQVKFELNGRYGFSLLAEDESELNLEDRGDFFDSWFLGFSIRNDNPGFLLDESYFELGWGRSDNFVDNSGRFKANAFIFVDLGATVWDLFLGGRFDSDRGDGADDLRVMIGFQRELTEFVRNVFGTTNP